VNLDDGRVKLTARYGEYFVEPKRAFFRNQVVVRDSSSTVLADSLTYYRKEKRSIAEGNVSVQNQTEHLTITGHRLEHLSNQQITRITEQPVLVKFDTTSTGTIDTLVVRSRVMESYRDSLKRLLAIDSVEIVRSNLAGTAGFAEYFTQTDSIHLRLAPIVWYNQTQVTGDSIDVAMKARKLDRVHVMGRAFAVSQSDSLWPERYDQITGDRMVMQFADQGLDNIDVQNRSISVYHLYEDSTANGLNKTSGDRIVMLFEMGKVKSIRVVGGVEGQYFPENMVQGKEMEYAIPGFMLHPNRPRINASDFVRERFRAAQMDSQGDQRPEKPDEQ
jgi:lipopolysaccharide export system protein LptA